MALRVTVLGSGTSSGVPVIGCECRVCTSRDPRNRRTRTGVWLEWEGASVLIDTATDLREQALRERIPRVDAVLFTHAHADHIFGLDELRIYNFRQRAAIPCYGSPATLAKLRQTFAYVFEAGEEGGGKPQLALTPIDGPFDLAGRRVTPVPVRHGGSEVLGFRIGRFAYVTDVSAIPESSLALLAGLEVLILGALRYRRHPTHMTLAEASAAAERIGAGRTFFTHLAHDVDAAALDIALPPAVDLAHDGLRFELA